MLPPTPRRPNRPSPPNPRPNPAAPKAKAKHAALKALKRTRRAAERAGVTRAALVNRAADIDWSIFGDIQSLGVTAGASRQNAIP